MIQQDFAVKGDGGEVVISTHIVQKNHALAAFNQWRRSLPPQERQKMKDVKIVGFYPVYCPQGMFEENISTIQLDPDQLSYMIREAPEFRSDEDPLAPKPRMMSHG